MDVRVMIPDTRRALDGPTATSSASVSTTLTDEQVKNLIADASADVLLLSGGSSVFGHTLIATSVDESYGAPAEWAFDTDLSLEERRVIVAQAALSYFYVASRDFKASESIEDEGQKWAVSYSAQFIRDQLKYLIAARDRAIDAMLGSHPNLEAWIDFVHERDLIAWTYLEPEQHEGGGGIGGQVAW